MSENIILECPSCGAKITDNKKVCDFCGSEIPATEPKKDIKETYHWDNDASVKEEPEAKVKRSKKVEKRQIKEKEKNRRKDALKELQRSRITKKGRTGIIVAASVLGAGIIAVILWLVLSSGALSGVFGQAFDMTKTLAKFEGGKVTQKEMDKYIVFLKNQDPASVPAETDPKYMVLQQNIVDSITVLKLLDRYGAKNGFVVTDQELSAEYDNLIKSYASQAAFEQDLIDRKIDRPFLDEQIKSQLLRDKIYSKVTEKVVISDAETQKYYEDNKATLFKVPDQVKVSHILIKFNVATGETVTDANKAEAKKKIDDVASQLKNGADFAEMATKYSEDTASVPSGGDIGFISAGQTVPEFEAAAFALEVGKVSDVVETTYGYHILKVTEKKASYVQTFDEVKDTVKSYLLSNKQMEEWQKFVYSLVDASKVIYTTAIKGALLDRQIQNADTSDTTGQPATETTG
jgi:parvulin-like peptidyl-prolyl isomerase